MVDLKRLFSGHGRSPEMPERDVIICMVSRGMVQDSTGVMLLCSRCIFELGIARARETRLAKNCGFAIILERGCLVL
jgi:hypothetical protein